MRPAKIAVTVPRQQSSAFIDYLQRIRDFGADPIEVLPQHLHDRSLWGGVTGLLLPGGGDVEPARYGAERHPATDGVRPELDELEIELLQRARAQAMPILAICRGHQLLNVALGGALHQHIDGDNHRTQVGDRQPSRWHDIGVEPACRLSALLGEGTHWVNSRHHQAVLLSTLAPELRPVAMSPDGFVEAMESRDGSWIVAVQWHPEREELREQSQALFEDFIEAATVGATPHPAMDGGQGCLPYLELLAGGAGLHPAFEHQPTGRSASGGMGVSPSSFTPRGGAGFHPAFEH